MKNVQISSFAEVVKKFKVVFFDSDGVLRDAKGPFLGVSEALKNLKKSGQKIWLITNSASLSPAGLAARICGTSEDAPLRAENVVSSGMAATRWLKTHVFGKKVICLGHPDSYFAVEAAGCEVVPLNEGQDFSDCAAFALLTMHGYDWNKMLPLAMNVLRGRSMPLLCPNADLTVPVGEGRLTPGPYLLAGMLEKVLERSFVTFGKPHAPLFEMSFEKALEVLPSLKAEEVLMVGDNMRTDILGAKRLGFKAALVLSGVTRLDELSSECSAVGVAPDFVAESIFG